MVDINDKLISYVAELGKLELNEAQMAQAKIDFEKILNYMNVLNSLDTDGVEPLSHTFPIKNVMREDECASYFTRDQLLENAPQKKDGCFKVPKTVE